MKIRKSTKKLLTKSHSPSKNKSKKILIVGLIIFLAVTLFTIIQFQLNKPKYFLPKAASEVASAKKGVAGPATLITLSQLKTSWFHNWGYTPGYKDQSAKWDAEIWKKFVPLFYGKRLNQDGTMNLTGLYSTTLSRMNEICSKTAYCNKGNYYLVGNEPDVNSEDRIPGSANPPRDAAIFQGTVIKAIREKDPTAKFIVLGLSNGSDHGFVKNFISEWKIYWRGTEIAPLPDIIKGWHFHDYNNNVDNPNDLSYCPSNDNLAARFSESVNQQLKTVFGKTIANQEIWITEMGSLGDNVPNPNDTSVLGRQRRQRFLSRMRCLVNVYESSPIVNRYAWFYHGCNPATDSWTGCATKRCTSINLLNVEGCSTDGGNYQMSDLGLLYSSLSYGAIPTTPPPSPTQPPSLSCNQECFYGQGQCNSRITPQAGYSCQINPGCAKCNHQTREWCWSYCATNSPTPTTPPVPTSIAASPTPTSKPLSCEPQCFYGPSQCAYRVTPKPGYSCKLNYNCDACNPQTGEWCWSYCR